ncbi:VOC family protein [Bacillus cihuensis]|uniref:VOC family protein n=1 Tax=Bacillus cihuensis TaxID=1208599 RepID=UPI0004276C55|nr:VOC family protein [Bacillus cihuensis]
MAFVFDHLVHFVEDPKVAIEELESYGIHAVEGGVHEKRGTYNTLSYYDLSYIEFLGTYDRILVEQTEHLPNSLQETIVLDRFAEGFSRFAVRTTNIDNDAEKFREKGLKVNGPVPYSRKRPDGSLIEWQLLFVGDDQNELQLPFIIQWHDSDEVRRNEQIKKGVIVEHPAGIAFSHVMFAVKDVDYAIEKWSNLLELKAGDVYIDDKLQAKCQTLELEGGNLVFCSPIGDGIVSETLEKRGEKPFQVNFSGGSSNLTFELLGGVYNIINS